MTGRAGSDVVVIGGGIVGASCAYFLSLAGASVTLVEREHLASGSSGACQSHVALGIGTTVVDHAKAALRTHAELRELGIDEEYQTTGGLFFADTRDAAIKLADEAARMRTAGVECTMLDDSEVRELEPALAPGLAAVAYEPDGAQISPMATVMGLASAARRNGCRLALGEPVAGLAARKPGWIVSTAGAEYSSDHVVIAAGAWSREIGHMAGLRLPIWPRKGHILVTEPRPRLLRHFIFEFGYEHSLNRGVERESRASGARTLDPPAKPPDGPAEVGAIVQPLPSGQLLVGSSREFAGLDRGVDRQRLAEIAARAARFLPSLASVRVVRTYSGLRPWSIDGMPMIGPCEGLEGLWLATGHGGGGITSGPLAGRLIGELITGGSPLVDVTPMLPDRFGPGIYAGRTPDER